MPNWTLNKHTVDSRPQPRQIEPILDLARQLKAAGAIFFIGGALYSPAFCHASPPRYFEAKSVRDQMTTLGSAELRKLVIGSRIRRQNIVLSGYTGTSFYKDGRFSTGDIKKLVGRYRINSGQICLIFSNRSDCFSLARDVRGNLFEVRGSSPRYQYTPVSLYKIDDLD